MSTQAKIIPRALSSENGKTWQQSGPERDARWPDRPDESVVKLVLGRLGDAEEDDAEEGDGHPWAEVLGVLEAGIAERFPKLTHLHVWGLPLTKLGPLPEGLEELDIRSSRQLTELDFLPNSDLKVLVIRDCTSLSKVPDPGPLPRLRELEIRECGRLPELWLHRLVTGAGVEVLWKIDLSGSPNLWALPALPEALRDLRLSNCPELASVSGSWPVALKRLELDGCRKLSSIPPFPEPEVGGDGTLTGGIDYLNLADTPSLRSPLVLPKRRAPRTLFLFGSGIPLDASLKGTAPDTNVAKDVAADQGTDAEAGEREADHEVKVILLGNGRCGKTSLARQLVGDGEFDPEEPSTHGVRLWVSTMSFSPQDRIHGEPGATLNFWDFAGQDLYHNTHRIFLESRAIYVICDPGPHGGGSCEENDPRHGDPYDEEGFRRPRSYWEEQIASLEQVGGVEIQDLVIRVKTKADRGIKDPDDGLIPVSAATGEGLARLKEEIRKRVAILLGDWLQRSLPVEAMRVKKRLRGIAAGEELTEDGSDHRRIPVSQAISLIRHEIAAGPYHDDPELLLRRFHRSGFLFYDSRSFKNWVILDQRWALDGIYAILSRESPGDVREKLLVRRGQFRASELREWVWDYLDYAAQDQALFIGLMQSCGTCFELLRDSETRAGEAVYVATGFLAPREDRQDLVEEIMSIAEGSAWSDVTLPNVSESEVQGLVSWIGEHWGRSATLWRWGARLRVHETGASMLCDWSRSDPDGFTGSVRFLFYQGADPVLEGEIRTQAIERFRHPDSAARGGIEAIWSAPSTVGKARRAGELAFGQRPGVLPDGHGAGAGSEMGRGRADRMREDRSRRNGIEVTFSLAGGPGNEEIPLALSQRLEAHFADHPELTGKVLCYKPLEGEERLAEFTSELAKGDLVLVFWSRKYFFSPYCMPELHWIYVEPPSGRILDKRVRIYALDGEAMAAFDSNRPNVVLADQWRKFWDEWVNERDANATRVGRDAQGRERELKRKPALLEWHKFLLGGDETLEPFIRVMSNYRLARTVTRCDGENRDRTVDRLFEEVLDLLQPPSDFLDEDKGEEK